MTQSGHSASDVIARWPEESREAAQIVLDARGEPDEITESRLIWTQADPWKRVVATRDFYDHSFPTPHIDAVESVIDLRVPVEMHSPLAAFDGSVVVERTAGEISARCHDEQANFLALNLAHDIITGDRSVEAARAYYAKEFLDARRGNPTPYMDRLRFEPQRDPDADEPVLTQAEIDQAVAEG